MLKKFAVTGFKGFKDRIELDLSKHRNYEFNGFAIKNGIIKDGIIYGPNGSGKSNLGFAIFDILNHLSQKTKEPHHYVNAAYAGDPNGVMFFEYTFDFSGCLLEYSYEKDAKNIIRKEALLVDGRYAFNRDNGFEIDRAQFPLAEDNVKALRENPNNISIVNYLAATFPLPEDHYLNQLLRFVDSMLWFRCLESRGFMGLRAQGEPISEFIINNGLVDDFKAFLLEVSDQDYDFSEPLPGEKLLYCFIGGNKVSFIDVMSTGTSSLYLLYYWLQNIKDAKFLFIDEFDAFYHFKLAAAVCRRLFRYDCQILLTSHNTFLMSNDILRPDCNFILNHNEIKALCDCTDKDLRFGHNIEKLFRGGAFDI